MLRTASAQPPPGGLEAASVDMLYAAVAVLLGAVLAPMIIAIGAPLRWLSGLVLVGALVVLALAVLTLLR